MWRSVKMQNWSYCLRVWYYYSIVLRAKYQTTFYTSVVQFRLSHLGERFAEFFSRWLEIAENKNSMMVHAQPSWQSWPFRCLSSVCLRLQTRLKFKTDEENQLCNRGSDLTSQEIPSSLKLSFSVSPRYSTHSCALSCPFFLLWRGTTEPRTAESSCGGNQPLRGSIRTWKCSLPIQVSEGFQCIHC